MKVSIIGTGRVGAMAGFYLATQLDIDELVLVDIIPKLAEGHALDIKHALGILESLGNEKSIMVTGSESTDAIKGSDVVIITAGKPRKPGMTRMGLAKINASIMLEICESVAKLAPKSVLMVVSNPVDVLTYLAWKKTGFPRKQVFGIGNLLDTGRLWSLGYKGIVIGQHGRYLTPIVEETKGKTIPDIREEIKKVNNAIIEYKNGTEFGPAIEIFEAVKAVVLDSEIRMPVSAILQGEYGFKDIAIGVPAVLGKKGIVEIVEIELTKEQRHALNEAAEAIRTSIQSLGLSF